MSMKKNLTRITALLIAVLFAVPVLSMKLCASGTGTQKIYAGMPGFEGMGNVPLAMAWHKNFTRIRSTTSVHPDNASKSVELTLGLDEGKAFDEYGISSVTAVDSSIDDFDWNAHLIPRNTYIFGDASLSGAEGIRIWVSGLQGNGTVRAQLLAAPCRGPYCENETVSEYDRGFLFESPDISTVNDYATFGFESFTVKDWWTDGTIYSYLDKINAITLIFSPDKECVESGSKIYIADLSLYKTAGDYSLSLKKGIIRENCTFSAETLKDNTDITVRAGGKVLEANGETYLNTFGQYATDYTINPSDYPDGKMTVEMYDGDSPVAAKEVWVDTKEPFLNDMSDYDDDDDLNYGVKATETGGNLLIPNVVGDTGAEYEIYTADLLSIDAYENKSTLSEMKSLNPAGETALGQAVDGYRSTVSNDAGVPYQSYQIDVTGITGSINLRYRGKTIKNESLTMQAYNPKSGKWDELARGDTTGKDNLFCVSVPVSRYESDNKITVRVSEYLYGNGAEKLAWTTDTQYYIGVSSWTHYMTEQFDWFVEEYENSNIAYVCNTGDVVDGKGNENQWIKAREIHNKLDQSGVPNGVTPGNHDVGNADAGDGYDTEELYALWNKYFGSKYYNFQPWWGGGFMDNTSHYDLITIGGHDFVFLYLGLKYETTPEGVAWANNVIKKYPHRTVVILTHQYLSQSGGYMTGKWGFADKIKEQIIIPNTNVRIVLCGHEPSSRYNQVHLKTGITLTEILHDYQMDYGFNNGPVQGGSGLFRYLTFGENTLESKTYSKSIDYQYDIYDKSLGCPEDYTLNLDYVPNDREIHTAYFQAYANEQPVNDALELYDGQIKSIEYTGALDGSKGWLVKSVSSHNALITKVYPIVEKDIVLEPEVMKGDLDGDEQITVMDALAALRISVKLVPETPEALKIADIDKDGRISVSDALVILRVAAKLAEF